MSKQLATNIRKYANVLDMCDGTGVEPRVKLDGHEVIRPSFASMSNYEFPVDIVENKLVYVGDQLYYIRKKGLVIDLPILFTVQEDWKLSNVKDGTVSWTKPDLHFNSKEDLVQAENEGARIQWLDEDGNWLDLDEAQKYYAKELVGLTFNSPLERYRIVEHDKTMEFYDILEIFDEMVDLRFTKSGIDGSLSVCIIKDE